MDPGEILVDLAVIRKNGPMLEANKRRLTIDKSREVLQFKSPKDEIREYHVSQFMKKEVRVQNSNLAIKIVSIPMDQSQDAGASGKISDHVIKIIFKVPNENMAEYVAKSVNQMLKPHMADQPKQRQKPKADVFKAATPSTSSNSLTVHNDPLKNTSVLNKSAISRDLMRQGSSRSSCSPENDGVRRNPMKRRNLTESLMISVSDPIETPYKTNIKKAHIQDNPIRRERSRSPPAPRPLNPRLRQGSPPSSYRATNSPSLYTSPPNGGSGHSTHKSSVSNYRSAFPTSLAYIDELRNRKLANTGNSCFLNSTLQALAACPSFANYCKILSRRCKRETMFRFEKKNAELFAGKKYAILEDLLNVVVGLAARKYEKRFKDPDVPFPRSHSYADMIYLRSGFYSIYRQFNMDDQQDAHEYLLTLLGAIDDQMDVLRRLDRIQKDAKTGECLFKTSCYALNPVSVFQMCVETTYVCQKCEMEKVYSELRSDMGLTLHDEENVSIQTLIDSTSKWVAVEKQCDKCKHKIASSFERISKFPKNLCIYLKRYERAVEGPYVKKRCAVDVSMFLDMTLLGEQTPVEFPDLDVSLVTPSPKEQKEQVEIPEDIPQDETENEKLIEQFERDMRNSPVKLLGGNPTEQQPEEDVKEEAETSIRSSQTDMIAVKTAMKFKLVKDESHLLAVQNKFGLILDDRNFASHLAKLQCLPETDMAKMQKPGKVRRVEGDGNCFYRTISWYLTGSEDSHHKLRHANATFMKKFAKYFMRYMSDETEMERIEENGNWSGTGEIFAMATLLNVDIYTFNSDGWRPHLAKEIPDFSPMFEKSDGAIYITNKSNVHYDAVITLTQTREARMEARKKREYDGEGEDGNEDEPEEDLNRKPSSSKNSGKRRTLPPRQSRGMKKKKQEWESDEEDDRVIYGLVAAVCHLGECPDKGHYIAYTKDFASNQWVKCNDDLITRASEKDVTSDVSRSGYLLFYHRTRHPSS